MQAPPIDAAEVGSGVESRCSGFCWLRYEHKFQPEDRAFTVRVSFRKSRATHDEIRDALHEALNHLP